MIPARASIAADEQSQSPCSYVGKTLREVPAPAAEYPLGVPAGAGHVRERHSSERRDPIGTSARSPSLRDRGWSRQSNARRFEACASCPALELPLLQHAEELGLQFERNLPISSKKSYRHWLLRSADALRDCSVKAPFSCRTARFPAGLSESPRS